MCRDEPGGFDVVFGVQLEQSVNAHRGPKYAARNVGHVSRRTILCVQPGAGSEVADTRLDLGHAHHPLTASTSTPYPTRTRLPILLFPVSEGAGD